ncbi:hypothetical protein [Microtetraspora sp. NBRC 16547]|uniref:hypothetical protein n=1 Tax=Microtetraspora sp. NBRC 16547 TaxID=3030993 RepID=UPI0024A4554A|nr:hypothetical protein [Microtetraspora sp. NBRC 16547]GLX00360.1 hypothetical protein Misp02_44460 [Microtetraspora sp. NBRC 16547]
MRFLVRPHQIPVRLATGLFMLNSGLSKASADRETAASLHGMASGAYPFLKDMDPMTFVNLLSKSEIALGVALLLPVVPSVLAGAALTAFAGGLMGLYLKTPGLRQEDSLRPTPEGIAIAKDTWLVGIGASLLCEELGRRD